MFQDIKTPRKSLREILPKKNSPAAGPDRSARVYRRPPGVARRAIWLIVILLVVLGAGFFLSQTFRRAAVTVSPRQFEVALDGEFSVPYELVVLPAIGESRTVAVTEKSGEPQRAGGQLTIYNVYSSQSQTLIARTRFETKDGKIYRIAAPVTVPGRRTVDGQTVPGTIEVAVTADGAGPEYNIGPSEFTIPGFAGDPRFDQIYARSTAAIDGGSSGPGWAAAAGEGERIAGELRESLRRSITEQIRFQIPDDFILYDNALAVTFGEKLEPLTEQPGQGKLTLSANARAAIFNRQNLSQILVAEALPDWSDRSLEIINLENLAVVPKDALPDRKTAGDTLTIAASGTAITVPAVDEAALRRQLAGQSQTGVQAIFAAERAIEKAEVSFWPPWVSRFPDAPERIKIINLTDFDNSASLMESN